jgi:cytochrome P450
VRQTAAVLNWFFFFMTLHPEVQAKAQAEIDAVVDGSRLPTLTDRPALPYVDALFKEIMRMSVVGPMGVPHKTRSEDVHAGYLIPQNATVIPNMWYVGQPRNWCIYVITLIYSLGL